LSVCVFAAPLNILVSFNIRTEMRVHDLS
jgi:hypothetical protein